MEAAGGAGGGGVEEVVDEFACAGVLRGSLSSAHGAVERIFSVTFEVGKDDESQTSDGQIWLKLGGKKDRVEAAKLFVRGVVNQEEQQEVSYPGVLHCVFGGARGLFLDCLIRSTSAHIVVGTPGCLLISGLAEPVVRAYSLIADLVDRYEGVSRRSEAGDRGSGESLDSRRAFKALVEKWEDRHILDLLVLPGPVKEVLLDLVEEAGLGSDLSLAPTDRNAGSGGDPEGRWDAAEGATAGARKDPKEAVFGVFGGAEGTSSPQEVGEEEHMEVSGPEEDKELQFLLLLKFFTAMGYTEDVVKRVLAQTGPKEASQILDLVQQEHDRSQQRTTQQDQDQKDPGSEDQSQRNRPCEMEHREDEDEAAGGATGAAEEEEEEEGGQEEEEGGQEEDFVLGVLKKAAASCGYMEQHVTKVYNMLPSRSTHQLLLELQRDLRDGSRETEDLLLEEGPPKPAQPAGGAAPTGPEPGVVTWINDQQPPRSQTHQTPPEVKGPPMPTYSTSLDPPSRYWPHPHGSKQRTQEVFSPKSTSTVNQVLQDPCPPRSGGSGSCPSRSGGSGSCPPGSSVVVTGEQRFLEGLQMPFHLQLADQPGDPGLRSIIIDGSNVAMSHGLGHFFSCRGIALAVQHFWDRGHRNISALLPQWRQKSDPKTKEQHYLGELQKLGLVSFTPSREVQGKRISSYDDRLMLQLAQKNGGVIVTNDNLRDLSDESPVWRDIIKKRLLQYTFVGNHFMVPDDPLGRGGPHLDHFLRSDLRTPGAGNHSFAGVATSFPSSKAPRSQTEVLNYRDRAPGGAKGRGRGKAWEAGHQHRSPEETAGLRERLCQVFAGQDSMVALVLQCHPTQTDVNVLSDLILEQQNH